MSDPLEISDLPLDKQQESTKKPLQFKWEGCLEEFKDQYTSVELQKKALEWRD